MLAGVEQAPHAISFKLISFARQRSLSSAGFLCMLPWRLSIQNDGSNFFVERLFWEECQLPNLSHLSVCSGLVSGDSRTGSSDTAPHEDRNTLSFTRSPSFLQQSLIYYDSRLKKSPLFFILKWWL